MFVYASSTKHLALSRSSLATSICRIQLQIKNATRYPCFTQNSQVKTNNVSPSSQLYIAYSNLERLPNLRCSKCLMAAASIENCSCGGTIFSSTTKPFPGTLQEPQERNGRNPGTSLGLVGLQPSNPIKETGRCQCEGKSA